MNFVRHTALLFAVVSLSAASSFAQVYGSPVGHGGPGGPGQGGFHGGPGPSGPGPGGPQPGPYNPPYHPAPGPVYGSPVYGTPVYPGPYNPGPVYHPPVYNPGPVYNPPYNPPVYHPAPGPVYGSPVYAGPIYSGPVYQGPVYHFPVYPTYPTYPSGPCTIYSNNCQGSAEFYSVTNAYGQTIGTTYDYNQANQIAQSAMYNSHSCSYVSNQSNGYQQPNFCQIMPGGNAYGQDFYRVIDNQGRIVLDSCSYQEALNAVQNTAQCYQQ